MIIYSLLILNKSGGLIYQRSFNKGLRELSMNDYLILAGTIHGVHAIASNVTPPFATTSPIYNNPAFTNTNISGLKSIETDFFKMFIFQSLTGIKFILLTSTQQVQDNPNSISSSHYSNDSSINKNINDMEMVSRHIYTIYSDYVMKNPFYSLEMPIRCDLFDSNLSLYIRSIG